MTQLSSSPSERIQSPSAFFATFARYLIVASLLAIPVVSIAQSSPTLHWSQSSLSGVSGFAVTIDGTRKDYGRTPISGSGTCGCSVPYTLWGGRHTIVVSAYNAGGETPAPSMVVAPVASAGGPYTAIAGTALAVDASGSNHPAGDIVGYAWVWGDGGTSHTASPQTSHVYARTGTYQITLTVTDNAGATASASTTATVGSSAPPPSSGGTYVIWAAHVPASAIHGDWQRVSDSSAAGGVQLTNPNHSHAKIAPALASPANYWEATFTAAANTPYHLWVRMRAAGNSFANDSVHLQFSDSLNQSGQAVWRIGTTNSAAIVLQDGSGGPALSAWGWSDNGWGTLGLPVSFASGATHVVRVQQREDGVSIDQIVLSADDYLTQSPGARKNDTTILPASSSAAPSTPDIVLWSNHVAAGDVHGRWQQTTDATASGGTALWNPDQGEARIKPALASPANYWEATFDADKATAYHLWVRMRAQRNSFGNDSVHVQFNDSVKRLGRGDRADWHDELARSGPAGRIGRTEPLQLGMVGQRMGHARRQHPFRRHRTPHDQDPAARGRPDHRRDRAQSRPAPDAAARAAQERHDDPAVDRWGVPDHGVDARPEVGRRRRSRRARGVAAAARLDGVGGRRDLESGQGSRRSSGGGPTTAGAAPATRSTFRRTARTRGGCSSVKTTRLSMTS